MDFMRALRFPLDDENWLTKFATGTLATLVGFVLPFIPLGYQVFVARRVIHGERRPLPAWEHMGQVVSDGLMAFIAGLLYALPIILLVCVIGGMGMLLGDSDLGGMLFLCFVLCLMGFILLYALVAAGLYWMGIIRYAESGNFSDFLHVGLLWADVRENLGTLLLLLAYYLAFSFIMSIVTPLVAITIIGIPAAIFYTQIVTGHLLGQAGREIAHPA